MTQKEAIKILCDHGMQTKIEDDGKVYVKDPVWNWHTETLEEKWVRVFISESGVVKIQGETLKGWLGY